MQMGAKDVPGRARLGGVGVPLGNRSREWQPDSVEPALPSSCSIPDVTRSPIC